MTAREPLEGRTAASPLTPRLGVIVVTCQTRDLLSEFLGPVQE